ncbi:MAG: ribulose-phosphate 3-epimerase, partial [Clostridia bacterium]|nr:ribulose-phosphate 3-epimerase [Clostridia bacterium]
IDLLLIMTVQAGFGGQSFKEDCVEKARMGARLRAQYGYKYEIEIDGGVSPKNIELLKDAGADVVVAGNSVFKSEDPALTIKQMQI